MEKVSIKNSPTVCENNLASEVNQVSANNVSVVSYPKSTCRIKNGLVNGVSEEKCSSNKNQTNVTTITNQDTKNFGCSANKYSQHLTQNCIDDTTSNPQSITSSLNQILEISKINQMDFVCTESSNSKGKGKHKKKTKLYSANKTLESSSNSYIEEVVDSAMCNSEITECKHNTDALVNPTSDQADVNQDLILNMHRLNLENPIVDTISECTGTATALVVASDSQVSEEGQETTDIVYVQYESELQMPLIMKIIQKDLSEPYSIYTYRYFIHNWPKLCFLAMCDDKCVGAIVCKLDYHRKSTKRGYIAMLAVDQHYRKRKIGSTLVRRAIREMIAGNADEVVLETEVTNKPALRLYELLGFVRDKRLFRYYLNGVDALRLKLWLR